MADQPVPAAEDVRGQVTSSLVETFRTALMEKHHQDWDMETISEAAHICAEAWANRLWPALTDGGGCGPEPHTTP